MDGYRFSLADAGDAAEVIGLYRSLIGSPGCSWNQEYPNIEDVETDILNEALYVLRGEGGIAAAVAANAPEELSRFAWAPQNPCELARLGVRGALQRQGVGTLVLNKTITAAKERGYDGIIMLVAKDNPGALSMYEKNGFLRCGETFMYDIDFYRYQMTFPE